ncbi:SDR family NAD(P)-dependent oxidoreductase [Brevibacillus dissolubilis]|uniref:SDR family NAD(P)-dependent oxidoreductase n=1 Tax=Brevibacillus dissolubilis TaxID=1844116 RepID=UPI00111673AB|nr:3-oxoacyl-ACP reductase FabG [Brevibacillus dissolubilis]
MLLKDKNVIITGATRGIGKSIFYRLAEEGARVIGVYASSDESARVILDDFAERGLQGHFFKGSITDTDFIKQMFADVKEQYGSIDVLVNNAGIVRDQFVSQMPSKDWEAVFHTNFSGTYNCCTEVLPYMLEQKAGKVVNVVSVTGVLGREAQTNYGASKGAIIGLTRMLSRKYVQEGIYFNAVAPGMIRTEMIDHVPKEKIENFLRYTNIGRLGESEEVANAVLYLSTHLSDYVTDTVIKVDGGFIR